MILPKHTVVFIPKHYCTFTVRTISLLQTMFDIAHVRMYSIKSVTSKKPTADGTKECTYIASY